MEVKVVNKSKHNQLTRGSVNSAGYDIRANIDDELGFLLAPGEIQLIPTGVYVELPENIEMQVRPRSGMALRGLTVNNSPGTVDEDYRGEVKIVLINLSSQMIEIHNGDRVAQIVFNEVTHPDLTKVDVLSDTLRGEGGFGHTGVK